MEMIYTLFDGLFVLYRTGGDWGTGKGAPRHQRCLL